ncbi:hypothetical protein BK666_23800 [Pseudomonas frederiksbergensis]|uniref:Uncharacterized protein n=1 Tax=Pseudomonas frederiksbergensis TaxID=104087 RepID=A0A423JW30_9PSED|nr:hypothetical protein BK666_23800 [Pseudomonas frederiksbergensis]
MAAVVAALVEGAAAVPVEGVVVLVAAVRAAVVARVVAVAMAAVTVAVAAAATVETAAATAAATMAQGIPETPQTPDATAPMLSAGMIMACIAPVN